MIKIQRVVKRIVGRKKTDKEEDNMGKIKIKLYVINGGGGEQILHLTWVVIL